MAGNILEFKDSNGTTVILTNFCTETPWPSAQIRFEDKDGYDIHFADLENPYQVDRLIEALQEVKKQMQNCNI